MAKKSESRAADVRCEYFVGRTMLRNPMTNDILIYTEVFGYRNVDSMKRVLSRWSESVKVPGYVPAGLGITIKRADEETISATKGRGVRILE